jgi:hypothetical protein
MEEERDDCYIKDKGVGLVDALCALQGVMEASAHLHQGHPEFLTTVA